MESASFWSAFSQTAATLVGFTLAGFSIYMASAERAGSDDLCRQYGFHDNSSRASWAFVYLILMLFCIPLLLSLLKLWGPFTLDDSIFPLYDSFSILFALGFLSLTLLLAYVQVSYFRNLAEAYAREEEFSLGRSDSPAEVRGLLNRLSPRADRNLRVFIFSVVIFLTLLVLLLNVYSVLVAAWEKNHIVPLVDKIELFSPGSLAMISVAFGLLWIYFHFHMFRPERLLFVVNDPAKQDLKRFRQSLIDASVQIKEMQSLLLPIIVSPDQQLLHGIMAEERSELQSVDKRLKDLRYRLEGWSWNAKTESRESRLQSLDYHLWTIDYCLGQQYMRYGAIKRFFKELELYDQGLSNLLRDLVRTWEQFRELSRFAEIRRRWELQHIWRGTRLNRQSNSGRLNR